MRAAAVILALVAVSSPSVAGAGAREEVAPALHAASVLVGAGCSGVLADGPDLVLTANHCIQGQEALELRFSNGDSRTGWVVAIDAVADQALLALETPVAIAPLKITPRPAIAGAILYFEGAPHDPRFQEAKLERIGACPSLPTLQDALFTTIVGRPGDSGAPIVDAAARVVGLVHGGAQCQIATPAETLRRLIARFLADRS